MKATIAIACLFLVHECKIKSNMRFKSVLLVFPNHCRICTIQTADPENSLRMIVLRTCSGHGRVCRCLRGSSAANTQALFPLFLAVPVCVCCFEGLSQCAFLQPSSTALHHSTRRLKCFSVFRRNQAYGGHKATVVQGCLSLQGKTPLFSV